jgi:hypothetical protein
MEFRISDLNKFGGFGKLIQISIKSYFMRFEYFQCLLGQNGLQMED